MTKEANINVIQTKHTSILTVLSSSDFKNSLQQYLPKGLSAERMAKIVLADVRKNPKLLTCDKMSFLAAISQAAQLGLEPGILGHCYLLPYDNRKKNLTECQLIIGYKGMIDLIYRSGKVATIQANTVDEADTFLFNYGAKPNIHHVPAIKQSGNVIYVYAVITFKDGSFQFVVLTMDEITKIRACSKGINNPSHPWHTWSDEMMKKTALKRLFKYIPISIEVATALVVDEAESTVDFLSDTIIDEDGQTYETKTETLIDEILDSNRERV
jgi:recombination protein RecT